MNTLTKLALGLMGQLRPQRPLDQGAPTIALPAPRAEGGKPLMQVLDQRRSSREFAPQPLPRPMLADLLWAAAGINRPKLGGRTAPSAMNAQEVDLYVALPEGLYLYEPVAHRLRQVVASDVRRVTGYQDFVDSAPLDLIYVADHARMKLVPADRRTAYAHAAAGAMAQNVYLFCASAGLGTVIRAWFDARALTEAMELGTDQHVLLAQTVGRPARAGRASAARKAG